MQEKWKRQCTWQKLSRQCGVTMVTMARNVIWPQKWGSDDWSRCLLCPDPARTMLLSPSNGWIQNTRSMTATDIYLLQTRSKSEVVWPHYNNKLTQNACKVSLSVFLSGWFSEKCAYSMNTGLLSLKCWHQTVKVRICVWRVTCQTMQPFSEQTPMQ